MMLELAQGSLSELPLFALVAIGAYLVVSASQNVLHYGIGHHRVGGVFFGATSDFRSIFSSSWPR
jgi:hypothetical protein